MKGEPVPVYLLKEGMILFSDIFRGGQLLLGKGQLITQQFIDHLHARNISEVLVSPEEAEILLRDISAPLSSKEELYTNPRIAAKVIRNLYEKVDLKSAVPRKVIDKTNESVSEIFNRLWSNEEPDLEPLRDNVNEIIENILSQSNAAPKLEAICNYDEYTYVHSTNVCIIMAVALLERFPKSAIQEFAFAALLHDIGKTRVPLDIINKPDKLTEEEFAVVKKHPELGVEIIKGLNYDFNPDSFRVILEHHERYDGTGYPSGKKDKEISMQSYIAGVCDVYDALTTKRSYKDALPFSKAVQIILKGAGSHFHPFVIDIFLEKIGFYPLGSVVKLNSNEFAVVVELSQDYFRPVLNIIKDKDGKEMNPSKQIKLIDDNSYRITRSLSINEICKEI